MEGRAWDVVLVGGGLANGLIAYRLASLRPELRVLVGRKEALPLLRIVRPDHRLPREAR